VAKMLDNLILEQGVSVMTFHEKEVVEFLVRLYQAYYTNVLKDAEFPWNEQDLLDLQKRHGEHSEDYQRLYSDLKSRKWIPRTNIELGTVETWDVSDTLKKDIYIKDKQGLEVGFSFPRYGDIVVLRNFIIKEWREKDKQFAALKDMIKFRRDAEERVRQGEDIALYRIPNIPEVEKERYKEYEAEKSIFGVYAIKALHLIYFDGVDLATVPLRERMEYAKDPRIDYTMMKTVSDYFQKMEVGIKDDISMFNPIKEVVEKRRYSFRLVDILQAIKLYEPDEYVINFEPSHRE
jgi:hypothetical protein